MRLDFLINQPRRGGILVKYSIAYISNTQSLVEAAF